MSSVEYCKNFAHQFPVHILSPPPQRTLKCVSSETRGKVKARSPRPTSTGRSPSCSAHRPTATPTWRSPWGWRCSSAGHQTGRSASPWTSSTSPMTQVTYDVISCHFHIFCLQYVMMYWFLCHLKRFLNPEKRFHYLGYTKGLPALEHVSKAN